MPVQGVSLRLSDAMRLKTGRDFSTLKTKGRRLVKGCLIANWLAAPEQGFPRLGVITSKSIGSAVVRNRARRLLREAFRQHQHDFSTPVNLVLVARASIAQKSFTQVEQDFLTAMRSANLVPQQ